MPFDPLLTGLKMRLLWVGGPLGLLWLAVWWAL